MNEKCPICEESIEYDLSAEDKNVWNFSCLRCGKYRITAEALKILKSTSLTPRTTANASGWIRENQNYLITRDNLDGLLSIRTPSFHERADKILFALEKNTEYAGQYISLDKSWLGSGWCLNDQELEEIINFLETSTSRIAAEETIGSGPSYKITSNGWVHLEKLKQINIGSQQGFVAIWFDEALQEVYDKAISEAIYDAGYKPHRVDQREHNNKIDDEIIAEIRRSKFILADFTGHRGGVYYEAGFAKGLGLEVFWTCKKEDIDNLHFDIRQYNCIDWESDKLEEFSKRITFRIESVIGRGTYRRAKN